LDTVIEGTNSIWLWQPPRSVGAQTGTATERRGYIFPGSNGGSVKMRPKGPTAALTLWIQIRTLRQ
jgi:hypothetical protein